MALALWQPFSATRIGIGFVCETHLSSVDNNYYNTIIVVSPIYKHIRSRFSMLERPTACRESRNAVLSQPTYIPCRYLGNQFI